MFDFFKRCHPFAGILRTARQIPDAQWEVTIAYTEDDRPNAITFLAQVRGGTLCCSWRQGAQMDGDLVIGEIDQYQLISGDHISGERDAALARHVHAALAARFADRITALVRARRGAAAPAGAHGPRADGVARP